MGGADRQRLSMIGFGLLSVFVCFSLAMLLDSHPQALALIAALGAILGITFLLLAVRAREQEQAIIATRRPPTITDMGLLALTPSGESIIFRQGTTLPIGTGKLHPFAVLRRAELGQYDVRFELRDGTNTIILADVLRRELTPGETVVVTDRALPFVAASGIETWSLTLYIDGRQAATHTFRPAPVRGRAEPEGEPVSGVQGMLSRDGELTDELIAALAGDGSLSLDELLEDKRERKTP